MSVWAIVLGGGSGARFGGAKQFLDLGGRSLILHSVTAARQVCDGVVAVVPDPDDGAVAPVLEAADRVVTGGEARADSVRAGLAAVPAAADVIVVADAAHPLASAELFATVVKTVRDGAEGAFPALPLVEAVATLDADGARVGAVPREGNVLVQMPQAFRAEVLRAAHAGASGAVASGAVEDSAMVAAMRVGPAPGRPARVVAVPGEVTNVHVTTADEFDMARALLVATGRIAP
jgi:2-C-methyl-D-erythritol 4-phosphate cytidylyltransferase